MPYGRNIHAQLEQIGGLGEVHVRAQVGDDEFGNPEWEWVYDRDVITVRSYPNRNTEREGNAGTLEGDRPVFVFAIAEGNQPAPPTSADRFRYDGTMYELESPTKYETHVEMMANAIDS